MRKTHNKDFKFKVALEAIRGDLTIAQIVSKYQVAESLVHKWKKQLQENGAAVFSKNKSATESHEQETAKLYLLLRGLNPRYLSPSQVGDLVTTFGLDPPFHE